jgi:hypothetical protein
MNKQELRAKYGALLFEGEKNQTTSGMLNPKAVPEIFRIEGNDRVRKIFPNYSPDMEVCRISWGEYPTGGTKAFLIGSDGEILETTTQGLTAGAELQTFRN